MNVSHDRPVQYGVQKQTEPKDSTDLMVEQLRFKGYCILPSVFSENDLVAVRTAIDHAYETQSAEVNGSDDMKGRRDANLVLAPLAYDSIFLRAATDANLRLLSERIFGPNFVLLQQNAIINRPRAEHYQVQWHRDLNYQHFVSSEPLAISALFCIDDFNAETGGTFVLPSTHLREEYPSESFILANETQMIAKAGSILVFDSMLYHRAGRNISNQIRRGLNHVIGRPFMAQQIDLPRVLGGRHQDDDFLNKYLGYRWNPATDVKTWRSKHR